MTIVRSPAHLYLHMSCQHSANQYEREIQQLQSRCSQLRDDLAEARSENKELGLLLCQSGDRLDEQAMLTDMMDVMLEQHKEALAEKVKEIHDRDLVIGMLQAKPLDGVAARPPAAVRSLPYMLPTCYI
ncbi:hypothetical protein F4779DRAFT_49950 [Xylariaceae sp. FL0662B]|nr:hypothetical protein F4779DRAFT_49950 [Xylariaceae sp. FL0662B]